jgi:hypothetical protein
MSAQGVSTSHPLGRWLLGEPDGGLDRPHHRGGRLEAATSRSASGRAAVALGHEVAQGAGLHTLLAEAGQHVGDVGEIGLVRADEQHAAPLPAEVRVRVQQVRGAVQRDDGLAGAGPAVDDERAAGPGPDDRVLVGLDGAEHVAHPRRAAAAQAGDEGGLVVERGVARDAVGVNTSSQ